MTKNENQPDSAGSDSAGSDSAGSDSAESKTAGTESEGTEQKEHTIHLDQFLKTCGVATGGQAKVMIQGGEVLVNEKIETRRRRQLRVGDEVTFEDVVYVVAIGEPPAE